MLKNYIKYAFRYLSRNLVFTAINIFGLTVGIASFLLIINFIDYENSYDTYIEDLDNTYRVNMVRKSSGTKAAAISPPMGIAMQNEFSEVKRAVRFRHANNVLVRIHDEEFYENSIFYVDSTFLDVFTMPLLAGNREKALNEKGNVIISEQMAKKYFGDEDPLNQLLTINDDLELKITGVVGKPETPSHFEFGMLISFQTFTVPFGYPVTLDSWGWTSFPTYLQLQPGTDPEKVNAKFSAFITTHMSESAAEALDLELQPISKIHLYSKDIAERDGIPSKGDITYVNILTAIAFLILGLAIFNFTNLSTTLSLKRVREVGVRKTLGAVRKSVFWQYIIESMVIAVFGLFLSIALLEIFSQPLGNLFGVELNILNYLYSNWIVITLVLLVVGLAGGAYPAIFLSNYSPVKALKSKKSSASSTFSLKSILVGLQFVITIGLLAGSIVIYEQMQFMQDRDLGFNEEQLIALQLRGETLAETYEVAKQRFSQNPNVISVTASGNLFDGQNGSVPIVDHSNQENDYRISIFSAYYNFGETMGLEFIEGRDLSEKFANDSSGFILNQAAIEMLGWSDNPIGKQITVNVWEGEVIGVVKDFHFASLHENISPIAIFILPTYIDHIFLRTKPGNIEQTLASLESDWNTLYPNLPFDYKFLDDHIGKMYESDKGFSQLVYVFSILAIILASLGLFGMIAFNINTRMKEIGIRKVFGASVSQVVGILSKQYILLILLAAIVGLPISWYLLNNWLSTFAYKITLNPIYLLMSVIITLLIAFITMSIKTIAAATTNPVNTLKEE